MSARHWGHWWLTLFRGFKKKGMRQQPAMQLKKWDKWRRLNKADVFHKQWREHFLPQHGAQDAHGPRGLARTAAGFCPYHLPAGRTLGDGWPLTQTVHLPIGKRQRLTACSAVIGHPTLTLIRVQASLTWSHVRRRRYHGTCYGSGLLTQLFFYLVKLWQQVDPPRGNGTFNSQLTFIRFKGNRCLNNRLNNFLPQNEVFGERATVTDVGALSLVLALLRQQLLQLLLNGLKLTQSASLFTD